MICSWESLRSPASLMILICLELLEVLLPRLLTLSFSSLNWLVTDCNLFLRLIFSSWRRLMTSVLLSILMSCVLMSLITLGKLLYWTSSIRWFRVFTSAITRSFTMDFTESSRVLDGVPDVHLLQRKLEGVPGVCLLPGEWLEGVLDGVHGVRFLHKRLEGVPGVRLLLA